MSEQEIKDWITFIKFLRTAPKSVKRAVKRLPEDKLSDADLMFLADKWFEHG